MRRLIVLAFLLQMGLFTFAQHVTNTREKGAGYYVNPILAGNYADPSILRVGKDYYMVHSSFDYYPGLLIWHSRDLIHWTPVAHALHKYVGSVWAPDLVRYRNKYYIYFPAHNTNYVVTADSITGPWSDPVDLKIGNIDPFHFTDDHGKRFLFFGNGGYVPLSDDGLKITGPLTQSYDGWPVPRSWIIECFCLEGPKIFKRGDYYYLTVAEGGTAGPPTSHMVISARSRSPFGPWENSPYNPIVRTKSKSEKWWSKGHGTVFEDAYGKWWMVFHAYEKGYYNMGRQTLLQPIVWTKDGWYKTPEGIKTDAPIKKPRGTSFHTLFSLSDNFNDHALHPQWQFFGAWDTSRFHFTGESLVLKAQGDNVGNCSPLLCTPADHSYMAQVEMILEGKVTGGLVLFYNQIAHTGILADSTGILADLRGWQFNTEKRVIRNHVYLRLMDNDNIVNMYYSRDGKTWIKIRNSAEVSCLNHNALGGFLSLRLGICAMGNGAVTFRNFVYKPLH